MRSIASAARLVRGAVAGVVVLADGTVDVLPGRRSDPLLGADGAVLRVAGAHIEDGHTYTTFLWPTPPQDSAVHTRVTVVAATAAIPTRGAAVVLLSPPGDLRGLTARELEVLGYVVEGCSNQEISHHLDIAPRTVAAHLEHILAKLDAPSRTLSAVRAFRAGLYVPMAAKIPRG